MGVLRMYSRPKGRRPTGEHTQRANTKQQFRVKVQGHATRCQCRAAARAPPRKHARHISQLADRQLTNISVEPEPTAM